MSALFAFLLVVSGPPKAYIDTGKLHIPLAISSWCWGTRCGAPLAQSSKAAVFGRGATVRVELAFTPTSARVAVVGAPMRITRRGREIAWRATKPGGVTIRVTGGKGWVTYVGRIALRR